LKKTNFIHTLPPPVLLLDFEGGTASILPWIRRRRSYKESTWEVYTQEQREGFLALLNAETLAQVRIKPGPYIDVIYFDNLEYESYDHFIETVGNFDASRYNSFALDSLQEFAIDTQTFSKGKGNSMKLMQEVPRAWFGAQERAMIALRSLKNLRDKGVFVYLTASEDIAKDFVNSPLEKRAQGAPAPEPYSVRGTVNLPGKLAEGIAHLPDILVHVRLLNAVITWITQPEMLPGGGAHWDAKDRFGRLDRYESPNFRDMAKKLYGEEGRNAIYNAAKELCGRD
jgi:hypothetical protein